MTNAPHPLSRFAGAVLAAPVAGGLAAYTATFIVAGFLALRRNEPLFPGTVQVSSILFYWALLICLAYVLVLGTLAYALTRMRRRTLSLATAIAIGLLAGVVPFAIASFDHGESIPSALPFPLLAALCAVATAWTFWRLALSPWRARE